MAPKTEVVLVVIYDIVPVSVCPSVCHTPVVMALRWLSLSYAQGLKFSYDKGLGEILEVGHLHCVNYMWGSKNLQYFTVLKMILCFYEFY